MQKVVGSSPIIRFFLKPPEKRGFVVAASGLGLAMETIPPRRRRGDAESLRLGR